MKPIFIFLLGLLTASMDVAGQESRELSIGRPDAIADLQTTAGTSLVMTQWKVHEARIVKTNFNRPGPSTTDPLYLYPTGETNETYDIEPKAGGIDFDDSTWEIVHPELLDTRQGSGKLSFVWYRLHVTIPEMAGLFSTKGSTIVFEIVVDDYSEIWVNGKLNKTFGQHGNGVSPGFNARNRIQLTTDAKPGETFQIAVLGINGPLADLPDNYIWVRSATLDFYKSRALPASWNNLGELTSFDPAFGNIIDQDEKIQKLADGFQFTEGPVWHPDGYLLFSDPNTNVIYRYDPATGNVFIHTTKSGYTGIDIGEYHQPGSNGLAIDKEGRLLVCQHGNRRVIRHERKGPVTILADAYQDHKLNSPNDLVIHSGGAIYFTDPPYGLPQNYKDPKKEISFQGVYKIENEKVTLLTTALGGPNGIAFSPDEQFLYVGNWDIRDIWNTKTVWRFPVMKDGTLGEGKIFYNFDQTTEAEAIDGIKVDVEGNVFISAPGGVWVVSPQGKLIGKMTGPERPANMAWGDDGKSLYLTAHTGLYKIRVMTGGIIRNTVATLASTITTN
jgi:gluconolactonase